MEALYSDRTYSYAIFAFAVLALISAALMGSPLLIVLAIVLSLLSVIYLHSGHIINNIILGRSGIVEVSGGYSLHESMASAVRKYGQYYKGISVAELKIDSAASYSSSQFAGIIEKSGVPFTFTIGIRNIDRKTFTEALETKRRMKELAISNTPSDSYDKLNRLKRELSMIEGELKRVNDGSKPIEAFAYVSSSAVEKSSSEAANASLRQLEEVVSLFKASLGVNCSISKGEELMRLLCD